MTGKGKVIMINAISQYEFQSYLQKTEEGEAFDSVLHATPGLRSNLFCGDQVCATLSDEDLGIFETNYPPLSSHVLAIRNYFDPPPQQGGEPAMNPLQPDSGPRQPYNGLLSKTPYELYNFLQKHEDDIAGALGRRVITYSLLLGIDGDRSSITLAEIDSVILDSNTPEETKQS